MLENRFEKNILTTTVDSLFNWARRSSLWPLTFGLACCAIEMISAAQSRWDFAERFGMLYRASPRQADLMIISGTVTYKMAPLVYELYEQMPEPKWIISMGACANFGGPFDTYSTLQGVDRVIPVDVYVSGCPPTPEGLIAGVLELQNRVIKYETIAKREGVETAQNVRQREREAAGIKQVIALRQAGPAAHTVLVKGPEGEARLLPTGRRPELPAGDVPEW